MTPVVSSTRTPPLLPQPPDEPGVARWRVHLLRGGYAFVTLGLAVVVWPEFVRASPEQDLMAGVVECMLVAFSVLTLLGVRYPLRMLPILLWESVWKIAWIATVAVPAWRAGRLDGPTADVLVSCALVVVVLAVVPWDVVVRRYVRAPAEPWR